MRKVRSVHFRCFLCVHEHAHTLGVVGCPASTHRQATRSVYFRWPNALQSVGGKSRGGQHAQDAKASTLLWTGCTNNFAVISQSSRVTASGTARSSLTHSLSPLCAIKVALIPHTMPVRNTRPDAWLCCVSLYLRDSDKCEAPLSSISVSPGRGKRTSTLAQPICQL